MAHIEALEVFFGPEARKQGSDLVKKASVTLAGVTDTQVQAYAGTVRTKLMADTIEDAAFSASCSCPAGTKQRLCKHIWAAILLTCEKHPDFLECKIEVASAGNARASAQPAGVASYAEKQKTYRKAQYQTQKAKVKERKAVEKGNSRPRSLAPALSDEAQDALRYFALNGFDFAAPIDPEALQTARKVLARVFHPDKGGTHEEILELNERFEILFELADA